MAYEGGRLILTPPHVVRALFVLLVALGYWRGYTPFYPSSLQPDFWQGLFGVILPFVLYALSLKVYIFKGFSDQGKNAGEFSDTPVKNLLTDGAYAYVRNPSYTIFTTLLFWSSLMSNSLELLVCTFFMFLFFNYYVIPAEEDMCLEAFGKEFIAYKRRVKRWGII